MRAAHSRLRPDGQCASLAGSRGLFRKEGLQGSVAAHPRGDWCIQQVAYKEDRAFSRDLLKRTPRQRWSDKRFSRAVLRVLDGEGVPQPGPRRRLFIKHCHCADRASGASFDLERKSDELESAFSDQLLQVHKAFDVSESHVTADVMHLEIVAARTAWADRLDPKHLDFLVPEPGR